YQRQDEESQDGLWLVGSVVGIGGTADPNLAIAYFLSRFPGAPSEGVLPTGEGPSVGESSTWLAFDSRADGSTVPTWAVAFRIRDRIAVVAAAGAAITSDE